ncbi:Hypothetical protein POVN_LOCUS201 [uncultured virus]|nr:Hypothetical protein POVN_LOCUS201 [uncultured virus]
MSENKSAAIFLQGLKIDPAKFPRLKEFCSLGEFTLAAVCDHLTVGRYSKSKDLHKGDDLVTYQQGILRPYLVEPAPSEVRKLFEREPAEHLHKLVLTRNRPPAFSETDKVTRGPTYYYSFVSRWEPSNAPEPKTT